MIDDHPFVRAGLRLMIRQPYPDCDIIEADTAEQGLFIALNEPLDLILLDLGLPWTEGGKISFSHGMSVLDALQTSPGAAPVVVMSAITREAPAALARQRGARAFVSKGATPDKLWDAMELCLKSGKRTAAKRTDKQAGPTPASFTPSSLSITPRMFDVLCLALQGHPAKKIAQLLDINGSNVRHYLSQLYKKFGVANLGGLQAHFAGSDRHGGFTAVSD